MPLILVSQLNNCQKKKNHQGIEIIIMGGLHVFTGQKRSNDESEKLGLNMSTWHSKQHALYTWAGVSATVSCTVKLCCVRVRIFKCC